jgi:mono/diheme cytochrome c family protein
MHPCCINKSARNEGPRRIQTFLLLLLLVRASLGAHLLQAQNTSFHDAPVPAQQIKNPYAGQAQASMTGKGVYAHKCSRCHADAGEGSGNIPPLASGPTQTAPDGAIFWYITHGDAKSGMPSWLACQNSSGGKLSPISSR